MTNQTIKIEIARILDKHGLVSETSYDLYMSHGSNKQKKYFLTRCSGKDGSSFFFKFLVDCDSVNRDNFVKEIKSYALLEKYQFKSFRTLAISDFEIGDATWYIRPYVEGGIIGDAHSIISNQGIKNHHRQCLQILAELSEISPDVTEKTNLTDFYLLKIRTFANFLFDNLPLGTEQKVKRELEKIKQTDSNVLVHGDFHWGNIYFDNDGPFLTDWEYWHHGQRGEDLAKYITVLWQYPDLQQDAYLNYCSHLRNNSNIIFISNFHIFLLIQYLTEFQHWLYYKNISLNKEKYDVDITESGLKYFKNSCLLLLSGKSLF